MSYLTNDFMIISKEEFENAYRHETSAKVFGYFVALLFLPVYIVIFLVVLIFKLTFGLAIRAIKSQ